MSRQHAIEIFNAAVSAVHPSQLLRKSLFVDVDSLIIAGTTIHRTHFNNVYVIGAGKASAAMAVETERILGSSITKGLVTTKYKHSLPTLRIKIVEAAHPVPDHNCVAAVNGTLELLKAATPGDIIICLLSGGASALWCDVPNGATVGDVQTVFDLLIKSGAGINEINVVRKHLSGIKGGQLIGHCNGASVFTLIISDVPGDDLSTIASGPTVPDNSTFTDAYGVLLKYRLLSKLPRSILVHIEKGTKGLIPETPKPGDPIFTNTFNKIIGSNSIVLQAAADKAAALGYNVNRIDRVITGDAAGEAEAFVSLAAKYDGNKPLCILQGGETTVKVTGSGKGGRNQHFALVALRELSKQSLNKKITILSAGTDGTDGPTDAAGAVINNETLGIAAEKNLSIGKYLNNHDAYHFFEKTGNLVKPGPTQTNVMDIMMALVY
jgi:glycerate 2-kinase